MGVVELVNALYDAETEIERLVSAIEDTTAAGRPAERLASVMEYWIVAHKRISARLDADGVIQALRAAQLVINLTTSDDPTITDADIEDADAAMIEAMAVPAVQRLFSLEIPDPSDAALRPSSKESTTDGVTRDAIAQRLGGNAAARLLSA